MNPAKKSHKKLIIALIVIAVIAVLIGVFVYRVRKAANELLANMNTQETAAVERRDLVSTISASGTITAVDSKDVTSSLTNIKIESINVEVGDTVAAGDVLCVFDSEDLKRALSTAENTQAQNSLKNNHDISADTEALYDAYAEYNRQIPALQGAVDRAEREYAIAGKDLENARIDYLNEESQEHADAYDKALTTANNAYASYMDALNNQESKTQSLLEAIETAQYNLNMAGLTAEGDTSADKVSDAKDDLADATVTAPISGVVTAVPYESGDTYTTGTLFTIEDCSAYEITAKIDEYDIGKVAVGQDVVIKTNGTGDEEFSGKVLEIAPHSVSTTTTSTTAATAMTSSSASNDVTYQVKVSLNEQNDVFKLDMTAKLSIILDEVSDVLTVPYEAVQQEEDGSYYVEVVDSNTVSENETPETGDAPNALERGNAPENLPSQPMTRHIAVKKGIESDYYTEVISDELSEGMEVVVPRSDSDNTDLSIMFQQRGPMGGM